MAEYPQEVTQRFQGTPERSGWAPAWSAGREGDDPADPFYYVVMRDPEGDVFCVS